jgi:hypothetical protein
MCVSIPLHCSFGTVCPAINLWNRGPDLDVDVDVVVDWFAVGLPLCTYEVPMHLVGLQQAFCTPLLVSSVNARGAPRHASVSPRLAKEEIGQEMADVNFACDPTSM